MASKAITIPKKPKVVPSGFEISPNEQITTKKLFFIAIR